MWNILNYPKNLWIADASVMKELKSMKSMMFVIEVNEFVYNSALNFISMIMLFFSSCRREELNWTALTSVIPYFIKVF